MEGKEFRFPFKPYPSQVEFMQSLYYCIENRKLGIFESPTGTGKSMSFICGSLTWLQENYLSLKSNLEGELQSICNRPDSMTNKEEKSNSAPAWFNICSKKILEKQRAQELAKQLEAIKMHEERINKLKKNGQEILGGVNCGSICLQSLSNRTSSYQSRSTSDILEDENLIQNSDVESSDEEPSLDNGLQEKFPQIIIATRTHSQISQLVDAVKSSPFGKEVRVCNLASRSQLCVNPDVSRLRNPTMINHMCSEMLKKKRVTTDCGVKGKKIKISHSQYCSFYAKNKIDNLKDVILSEVNDIESLVSVGKRIEACPYYAARMALSDAQVVIVPYSILLHKPTRVATGLSLKNNIIIIDEAHNLLDVINSMHSAHIYGSQLQQAHQMILNYQGKYSNLFSPKNMLCIKQLLFVTSSLIKFLGVHSTGKSNLPFEQIDKEMIFDCTKFCLEAGIDHINVEFLVQFCDRTKLPFKITKITNSIPEVRPSTKGLSSFLQSNSTNTSSTSSVHASVANQSEISAESNALMLVDFLRALANANDNGRIVCRRCTRSSDSSLKYILLNPASYFGDFVHQPRSVIVVGGTMQPTYEFEHHLFVASGASIDRIMKFSCGHIVSPDHVYPLVLTKGPSNKELDFSWNKRDSLLGEVALLLLNLSQVVPSGVVCFVPSYDFENLLFAYLNDKGYVDKIEQKKKFFREPRKASDVDKLLAQYSSAVRFSSPAGTGGALLVCVVGGKLSEGINFSDDLARCVVVIGLPFANATSVEIKERMNFLNLTAETLSATETKSPGQLYYESLCFKAVNQSIGRAIRHSNDYAAIVLADYRYARPTSISYLPGWISKRISVNDKFGQAISSISQFLRERAKSSSLAKK